MSEYIKNAANPLKNSREYLSLGEDIAVDSLELYHQASDLKKIIDKMIKNEQIDISDIEHGQFVIVSSSRQLMFFFDYGKTHLYIISTAKNGLGEVNGSFKTPRGAHKVLNKIGEGLPPNAIFKAREWTGEIWSKENREKYGDRDLILSRILWLDGLEERNSRSHERYIYFHGTNGVDKLGTPASHGCIRMGEQEVIDFFNNVDEGLIVYIF